MIIGVVTTGEMLTKAFMFLGSGLSLTFMHN